MIRALVICVEVALLVIVLRSAFVQYWLTDAQSFLSDWFISISEMPERHELGKLREQLNPHMSDISESQINYLDRILHNKASFQRFYRLYCIDGDINPYVYGQTLRRVCDTAQRSGLIGTVRTT